MTASHVLGGLVNAIQFGRIIDGPTAAGPQGISRTMPTPQTNLMQNDGFLAALCVGFDVFLGGFKEFELLSDENLVIGELFGVTGHGEDHAVAGWGRPEAKVAHEEGGRHKGSGWGHAVRHHHGEHAGCHHGVGRGSSSGGTSSSIGVVVIGFGFGFGSFGSVWVILFISGGCLWGCHAGWEHGESTVHVWMRRKARHHGRKARCHHHGRHRIGRSSTLFGACFTAFGGDVVLLGLFAFFYLTMVSLGRRRSCSRIVNFGWRYYI